MPGLPIPFASGPTGPPELTLTASVAATTALRFAASSYAAVLFARPGLRGYWPLDEAAGPTGYDRAGATAEDASYAATGVTYAQTGVVAGGGGSARFDGTDGNTATAGAASEIDVGDTFTLALWLARERTGAEQIARKGTLLIAFTDTDLVEVSTTDGAIARSTTAITDTNAHMIAVTKNGATTAIYIDGVDVTDPVADHTIAASSAPLVMAGS